MSTMSSRVRTTVRSALVSAVYGVAGCSRCARSRTYSAITAASPASDLAPDNTSPSRHVLIAFGLTGTTGYPASNNTSTSRPSGRSIPTATSAGSPANRASRRSRSANPAAVCPIVNWALIRPVASSTHTAWVSAAQSIPT